jgi:glycosyltransferase involved in cell wall biosynthesis
MAEPIKVAMLADKFENRGTSAYTLRLAEKFPGESVLSKIYCTDASLLSPVKIKQLGVREYRNQKFPIWGRIVKKFIYRRMTEYQPDLIHIQSPKLLKTGMSLAKKLKCPYVVTVHDLVPLKRRFPFDLSWGKRIICVSKAVQEYLVKNYSFNMDMISVIHSGVEIPECTQTLSVLDQGHIPVIGTAGPLEETKGISFFLEAAKIILDKKIEAEFLIAGTGPEEFKLRRLAQKLGINSHVTFVPKVYDFSASIMALDIFCLPSLSQGLGTIMLEAMARGKPVIASGVGGVFSVIQNQETGLVVPPSDSQALAEGIESFLNDPMKARTMGKTARRLVETSFGVEKMLDETLQVYRDILQIESKSS